MMDFLRMFDISYQFVNNDVEYREQFIFKLAPLYKDLSNGNDQRFKNNNKQMQSLSTTSSRHTVRYQFTFITVMMYKWSVKTSSNDCAHVLMADGPSEDFPNLVATDFSTHHTIIYSTGLAALEGGSDKKRFISMA